jgi:hypothetical protein
LFWDKVSSFQFCLSLPCAGITSVYS